MSAPNPVKETFSSPPADISKRTFAIGGILTTIFGLEELSPKQTNIACLWLLHPRLQTQKTMVPLATSITRDWNTRSQQKDTALGLITVTFDQRNHGSREVDPIANQAWNQGDERHAQNMFSAYRES
ncbi:MAG: hypothetical protein ACRYGG_01945 [Janthinobacterium lividum]